MTALVTDQPWAVRAACAAKEPDALFVRGAEQKSVRQLCLTCPVRLQCLTEALSSEEPFGVWGGLTERERRALIKEYPGVSDWWEWLRDSQDEVAEELRSPEPPKVIGRLRARRRAEGQYNVKSLRSAS